MIELATSEVELIQIASNLFSRSLFLREKRFERKYPNQICPKAKDVLQGALSKLTVLFLNQQGGWQSRSFYSPSKEKGLRGPIWARYKPEIKFSRVSFRILELLRNPSQGKILNEEPSKLEIGDQILLCLIPTDFFVNKNLSYLNHLITLSPLFSLYRLKDILKWRDFSIEMLNLDMENLVLNSPWVLEGLTFSLAKIWQEVEYSKNALRDPELLLNLGAVQDLVGSTYLEACEKNNRHDLSCFFTEAGWRVLGFQTGKFPSPEFWKENLDLTNCSLANRQRVFKASGVFLHQLQIIEKWFEKFKLVSRWDEEYELAKASLQCWKQFSTHHEKYGTGFKRASYLYEELIKVV